MAASGGKCNFFTRGIFPRKGEEEKTREEKMVWSRLYKRISLGCDP